MTTLNLSDAQRATVEDSLSDYIEAQENAADVSDKEFALLYMAIANQALRVRESFRANADLSEADLGVIEYALQNSHENCVELAGSETSFDARCILLNSADDYAAALAIVIGAR